MSALRPLFRHHRWDALPALCGVGIVALIFTTFLGFHSLSWWVLAPAFVAIAWSYCWNMQCISHNFIHNPFFTNAWLNRAYSVLETLALGVPHILYHHYHLNHHFGDSDARGPDGSTRDWSSIYRYGQAGRPEAFWRYCLVSFFRVEIGPVLRVVIRHGREHILQCLVETVVLGAFWLVMALVDWRYFVFYYLTSYYLGWVLSYAEGYLEHFNAQPGNHFANSVSSYNLLYNLLWFNNGYHQEHHWDPKVHWTRMRELRRQIQPQLQANQTRILRGPHITALLEYWWQRRQGEPGVRTRSAA
ncbi:MAG TPA: fatty acid desaturase [Gemmataceae bacterium]|jgi:fatty acid desaturase|nr:fatty acid desaturase [Gemmataceae bacterium]